MTRPRLSLRLAMLLVAVVALGCAGWRLWERSHAFEWIATEHEVMSDLCRHGRGLGARALRLAAYHDALKTKYERAASYPWLPVEPDPPEPR